MFVATANTLSSIPGPLLDRMEIISIAGHTELEKYTLLVSIYAETIKRTWLTKR